MKKYFNLTFIILFVFSCTGKKADQATTESASPGDAPPKVSVEEVWTTGPIMKVPESVLYDQERNMIYVANIEGNPNDKDNQGFISKLKPSGEVETLAWVTDLNAPKGMGIYKNFLYVADITEVIVINIEEGVVVERYEIEGSGFLNDIAIDKNGMVYVTDSDTDKIHAILNGEINTWMEGDKFNRPNGLFCEDGTIMLASSGDSQLKKIDLATQEITIVAGEIGHGDGIAKDKKGNYVVSSWAGQLFYIDQEGNKQMLLDTRELEVNSADIDMIVSENLVLVPTFFDNSVVAYRLVFE